MCAPILHTDVYYYATVHDIGGPGRYLFITAAAGCGQRGLEGSEHLIVYDM
jgi:hypothetical protein